MWTRAESFVDPDTGVRLSKMSGAKSVNYVSAEELIDWSLERPNSLTAVFDQSYSRGKQKEIMKDKLQFFADHGVHGFAYCSHAPLLVLSKNKDLAYKARKWTIELSGLPNTRSVELSDLSVMVRR